MKNQKLSDSLKAKWASGTRKPTARSAYKKASETHKRQFADGTRKRPSWTTERAKFLRKMVDEEKLAEINRVNGLARIGSFNPSGPSARGPGHWKAKYYVLKSPSGKIIHGWNLVELVRSNEHLFDPVDLEPHNKKDAESGKYTKTKAAKRLSDLFRYRKGTDMPFVYSWKGWIAIYKDDSEPTEIVNFPIWK